MMIDKEFIDKTERSEWDFSNEILYSMCRENFTHTQTDKIIGKTVLIGRTYAAAIERRKNKTKEEQNDNFYIDKVAPEFKKSKLDFYLEKLKSETELDEKNIPEILKVHFYLTSLIKELTEQNKRSFSSKYLHFHLPHLFFIYDTRAVKAIGLLKTKFQYKYKEQINSENADKEYASFFYKCFAQKNKLKNEFNRKISTRHIDNILMKAVELNETKAYAQQRV
ncbi:hypothetical protein [Zunongwangia endophytica]|uniref:Uncharacterized protein n=1 Tax=Zunongwangia endophytica TaxID=1808945 RepID=A0ABV8H1Q9_9FLAO|nr:hypothetical protein [Zunongwangia endophytica]MDN3594246.1 hypothetical protein [Zunongwangia endophytica]